MRMYKPFQAKEAGLDDDSNAEDEGGNETDNEITNEEDQSDENDNIDDEVDSEEDTESDESQRENATHQEHLQKVLKSIDDDKKGMYYCVFYNDGRYWGRLINVFSNDVDDEANEVEMDLV